MTEQICLTCTKLTAPEQSVIVGTHKAAQAALSKHFWFSENESKNSILCCSCWGKIDDFQQFYGEIERIHTCFSTTHGEFVEVKQELNAHEPAGGIQEIAFTGSTLNDNSLNEKEEYRDIKSEIPDVDDKVPSEDDDDNDDDDDDDENGDQAMDGDETSDNLLSEANNHELASKKDISEEAPSPQKQRKKGNRVGRPSRSWQKNLKDEEFIADNVNIECDTCSQKYKSFVELQQHSLAEHKKRAYVFCCDQKFCRKPRLIDHIQFHLNPMQFQCDICSKQFRHSEALKGHKDKVHSEEEKNLQCSMCPKTFSRKKFLNIHERYHRKLGEKNWQCESCERYFAYESMLRQHIRMVHSNEYKYVCHVCARGFHILSSYTAHVESHDEDLKRNKPPGERVQCTECGSWVYKKGLRKHMLRHSGTQTCEHCGQECKSEMALRYHKAQHRKGDFNCSVCGKAFKRQITLKEHMASHTGEVLYQCDFCEKTFNSHANRAAHRKKMHPKEWLEDKMRKNPKHQDETV